MKLELQNIKKFLAKKKSYMEFLSPQKVVVPLDYSDAMAPVKQQLFVY